MSTLTEVIDRMPEEQINASDAHYRGNLEEATTEFLRLLTLENGGVNPGASTTPCTDRPRPMRSHTVPVGGSSAWF